MTEDSISKNQNVYLIGCDMGGWHNVSHKVGDAFAALKWDGEKLHHVEATAALSFFPIDEDSVVRKCLDAATKDSAKVIIGIDAALAWPFRFRNLVDEVPDGTHDFSFQLGKAIDNPYLYRQTERFIKQKVQTGSGEQPLTAVGDKFGNNSSKAQALSAWFKHNLSNLYRPPFDAWDRRFASEQENSFIKVYPAASMKSKLFKSLSWPQTSESMNVIGKSDIADAKKCAMTAFCYAVELGIVTTEINTPQVWMPDEATDSVCSDSIPAEGWIFAPKVKSERKVK